MSASTRKVLVPLLAASLVLVTSEAVLGQSVSSRPASIALTVVVPPRLPSAAATTDGATVLSRTDAALDLQAVVGIANWPSSRIAVRLGPGWSADSMRVLVQTQSGEFAPLGAANAVIAGATSPLDTDTGSRLRFRLEFERPAPVGLSIPIEYRVTVGQGDQIAIWTFASFLQVGGTP